MVSLSNHKRGYPSTGSGLAGKTPINPKASNHWESVNILSVALVSAVAVLSLQVSVKSASYPHNCSEAILAPSTSEASFIHTILESTCRRPAKVPNPQSTPAIMFSLPTTPA